MDFQQEESFIGRKSKILTEENQEFETTFRPSRLCSLKSHQYLVQVLFLSLFALYGLVVLAIYEEFNEPVIFISFLLLANFVILIFCGNYMVRSILFPYANYFISQRLDSSINSRFTKEFTRLIELLHTMIRIISQQDPLEKYLDVKEQMAQQSRKENDDSSYDEGSAVRVVDKKKISTEINEKMAQVLDLINLYGDVNKQIIDEKIGSSNRYFKKATDILIGIRDQLQKLPLEFEGYGPTDQTVWTHYKKEDNFDQDNDRTPSKVLPRIIQSESNIEIIKNVGTLISDFRHNSQRALKSRCCCCLSYNKMFGTLDQNQILLNKNFEGKHFWVEGHNNSKLDCMFFPCTFDNQSEVNTENPSGEYLDKPTFIMCNPNALLYQQMVTSPNAYWLTFFIKRGINVMCWNYRSYGKSTNSCFDYINPYNCKLDAEKVVNFVVNKIQVRGKIGVYGRSLGGIASCHLARSMPRIVSGLIVDRTFCEMDQLSERRLYGSCTGYLFKFLSFNWKSLSDQNFAEAKCYKILTSDPNDDVVDNYSSLPMGVASKLARHTYNGKQWKKFYESLCMVYDLEDGLYKKLSDRDQVQLNFRLIKSFESITDEHNTLSKSVSINRIDHDNQITNDDDEDPDEEKQSMTESLKKSRVPLNMDYLKKEGTRFKQFKELHQLMHSIVIIVDDFHAGTVAMKELINSSREKSFTDFQKFLKMLEIYGCGYQDDIDKVKMSRRDKMTHQQQAVVLLQEIIESYQMIQKQVVETKISLFGGSQQFKTQLLTLLQFQCAQFEELQLYQRQRPYRTDYEKKEQGHLVFLNCGHRGRPSRQEEKRISRLLRKSGFIPMLEELYKKEMQKEESKKGSNRNLKDLSKKSDKGSGRTQTVPNEKFDEVKLTKMASMHDAEDSSQKQFEFQQDLQTIKISMKVRPDSMDKNMDTMKTQKLNSNDTQQTSDNESKINEYKGVFGNANIAGQIKLPFD